MKGSPFSGFELLQKLPSRERADVDYIYGMLHKAGYECYLVGGCVRDLILGRHNAGDIDLTTNAHPKTVQRIFPRTVPTGIRHGTITVLVDKRHYEITTYRAESEYSDARRPDRIRFAKTLEEDLSRRDFTMNAIALEPGTGQVIDLHEGFAHIAQKQICTIGDPRERFFEDGLRPIRACRFLATLDFRLAGRVQRALQDPEVQKRTAQIAVERFSDELWKGFASPRPSAMIRALEESKLLYIFIEKDIRNRLATPEPVLRELSGIGEGFGEYKMALWWMGIGIEGKSDVEALAKRLKFPNKKTKKILYFQRALRYQKGHYWVQGFLLEFFPKKPPESSNAALLRRLFLSELKQGLGSEAFAFLEGLPAAWEDGAPTTRKILKEELLGFPLAISDLAVKGEDLTGRGYRGRAIGEKLEALLAEVLKDPTKNERGILLGLLDEKESPGEGPQSKES